MSYANSQQLIDDYLPEAKSQKEIAAVGRILEAASAFIDSHCKRPRGYFNQAEGEGSVKRVRGENERYLRLPPHIFGSITAINGEDFTQLGAMIYESDKNGWLYFESDELNNESNFSTGYGYKLWEEGRIYKVIAQWGFSPTPPDITEAARLITARIYGINKGTIGQISIQGFINERLIPQAAKDLLKPFIKRQFEI